MDIKEFKTWRADLNARIAEAEGIIKYSCIGGAVGSHNNRTPDQVKKANEAKIGFIRKVQEAKIKDQAEREKLKEKAQEEAKKEITEEVIQELFGKSTPIGLTGVEKEAQKAEARKQNDTPIGLSSLRKQEEQKPEVKPAPEPAKAEVKPEPKPAHTNKDTGVGLSGIKKANDNTEANKPNAQKQGVMDRLRDGLKNIGKNVADKAQRAVIGAKYDVKDAKDWLKNNYKKVRQEEAEKRGKTAGHYKDLFKKKDNQANKKADNNTASAENETKANTTNTDNGSANNGTKTVRIYLSKEKAKADNNSNTADQAVASANKVKDEEEARVAKAKAEKAKDEADREDWNAKNVKNAEGKLVNKPKTGKKASTKTTSTSAETTEEPNAEEAPKAEVKEEPSKTENTTEEPKEVKADTEQVETTAEETQEQQKKPRRGRRAKTTEQQSNAEENPEEQKEVKAETSDEENKEETQSDDKKEAGKAKEETQNTKSGDEGDKATQTDKKKPDVIKEIPREKQAQGKDVSNEKATEVLEPGVARGSNTLQHVKTKGAEEPMYDDDKGNPVPATPKEAKKDKVDGERTDKKVIIKKKDGSEKVSDMKEEPKADDKKSLADKVKGAKEKANGEKKTEAPNTEEKKETEPSKTVEAPKAEEKQEEAKTETEVKAKENKEEPTAETTEAPKAEENKEEATSEKTPEEKKKILDALRAKRVKEAQQKFLERQKENNKGGHEKSEEEIKANNEKIRKERNLPDEETEDVKKQEETVSSAWRKDFTNKAHKGDTKGLPDEIKDLMGKYRNYWKRINQKDHYTTVAEMDEGADLENKLKSLMRKYPDAFGKKATVKDGGEEEIKIGAPKKLNLSDRIKKKQSDEEMVDKFIEDNSQDEEPSDEALKAIEREQKKSKK